MTEAALADGRVVVGFDGSKHSQDAVRWAALDAAERGTTLLVVCADDPEGGPAPLGTSRWLVARGEELAAGLADEGATLAQQAVPGLDVVARGVGGSTASVLVEASADAAVVVTGTQGRGRFTGVMLGSVAFAVSSHAACPVVVVHSQARPDGDHPVLVGVDGSPHGERALALAAERATAAGAPLHVVCSWRTPRADIGAPPRDDVDRGDPLVTTARTAAADVAAAAADRVQAEHPSVSVQTLTPAGPPGRALVELSGSAGLVVVGSRGRGGFAELMLGSVSHELVAHSRCPVLVVPRRRARGR